MSIDDKLALAARVGAGRTVNGKDIDVPAAVRELTGGQGADASFEVVGHGSTVMNAIRSVRKGGTVVLIGNLSPKVEIPLQEGRIARDFGARIVRVQW
jgi:L-iditol 2-dehydrogenase